MTTTCVATAARAVRPQPAAGGFGACLRALRRSRDLDLTPFAQQLALTRVYVWQVENGTRAPLSLAHLTRVRTLLSLTNAEFAELVHLAAEEHVIGVRATDFRKPAASVKLLSLLAAHDGHIPQAFFEKITAWIEEHCK